MKFYDGQVTGFFREISRESCQIIVISLKEEFYSRADALIGVYSMVTQYSIFTESHITVDCVKISSWSFESMFYHLFNRSLDIGFLSLQFDDCMFSRLLTLDLTPYPLNDENGSKRE